MALMFETITLITNGIITEQRANEGRRVKHFYFSETGEEGDWGGGGYGCREICLAVRRDYGK